MLRSTGFAFVAWLVLSIAGVAHAAIQVQVAGTYPAGDDITLGKNQNFHLHLHYSSDVPVRIWAQPYFEGKLAKAGNNPSRTYPAGEGEALGWFFLFDPGTRVDEIRIKAGDGSYNRTQVVATYPVAVTGGDAPAAEPRQPEWVGELGAIDKAVSQAAYRKAMDTPPSVGDVALFNGFMLTMYAIGLLAFAGPAWGLWR